MQGSGNWSPPTGTLGQIISEAASRVSELRRDAAGLERAAADAPRPDKPFKAAFGGQFVGIIAEVKRRSPSKGWIAEGLSTVDQAHANLSRASGA